MQGSPSCVNDHSGSSTQFIPFRSALRIGNISSAVADDQPFEKGWSENFNKKISPTVARLNSTPFVRQYDILSNKWGVLLCQKEYQTNDIRRNLREWL